MESKAHSLRTIKLINSSQTDKKEEKRKKNFTIKSVISDVTTDFIVIEDDKEKF